jgi:hypothetical protein
MARPTADTVQITFRIPKDWLNQADKVASLISRPGLPASRTDALRAAIARGLTFLLTDHEEEERRHEGYWERDKNRILMWIEVSGIPGLRAKFDDENREVTLSDGKRGRRGLDKSSASMEIEAWPGSLIEGWEESDPDEPILKKPTRRSRAKH